MTSPNWLCAPFVLVLLFALSGCTHFEKNWSEPSFRVPALLGHKADARVEMVIPKNDRSQLANTAVTAATGGQTVTVESSTTKVVFTRAKEGGLMIENEADYRALIADAQKNKDTRNAFIHLLMLESDDMVARHKALIIGNKAMMNTLFGWATGISGALTPVFPSATTKSALGASAAIFNSMRATVNEEFFANQFATSILRAIDVSRAEKRAKIEAKMLTSHAEYPVEIAIIDVLDFHNAGSLMSGLTTLAESLEQRVEYRTDNLDARIRGAEAALAQAKADYKAATGLDFSNPLSENPEPTHKTSRDIVQQLVDQLNRLRVERAKLEK